MFPPALSMFLLFTIVAMVVLWGPTKRFMAGYGSIINTVLVAVGLIAFYELGGLRFVVF